MTYIEDHSTAFHFADDTNLLHINKDYESLQRKVYYGLLMNK